MATYTCQVCGMSVNMTCAKCGKELVHDTLTKADGGSVAVSKCPEGDGIDQVADVLRPGHDVQRVGC